MNALDEVAAERARQDAKWGGAAHDDAHESTEWVDFVEDRLVLIDKRAKHSSETRRYWLEIAALAVARIESMDRKDEK